MSGNNRNSNNINNRNNNNGGNSNNSSGNDSDSGSGWGWWALGGALLAGATSYYLSGNSSSNDNNNNQESYNNNNKIKVEHKEEEEESLFGKIINVMEAVTAHNLKCLGNYTIPEINKQYQPTNERNFEIKQYMQNIIETLNQELDQVKEVLKIGSFGRGVTIGNDFDVDLLVIFDVNSSIKKQELGNDINKLVKKSIELKKRVLQCIKNKFYNIEEIQLNELYHVLRIKYNEIQFDISVIPDINVNYNLKKLAENQISLQNLLSSLQFKQMVPKLKHETKCKTLIRLAKYWSKYNKPKPKLLSIFTEHLMHQVYDNYCNDRGCDYLMFLYFLQELKEYCLNGKYIEVDERKIYPSYLTKNGYWPDIANKANEAIKEIEESYKINLKSTVYASKYMSSSFRGNYY
ncbi:hypothetical protein ABK040_001346 [Willaertia magna]